MVKIEAAMRAIVAAALVAGPLLGSPRAEAQQPQGAATSPSAAKPSATGFCRVKDYVGGRTCTGNIPEAACAAIAREGKGEYTWTSEECP